MAKGITFSADTQLLGAGKTERKASIITRGTSWLRAIRVARHDSQIERYINEHGGILTDSLEREITQKFTNARPGSF